MPGYKRSDVGVIPEDWKDASLGEVAEIRMCKRIFAEQTNLIGDIPFFKIGTFGRTPDAFISSDLYREYKKKYSFPKKGDILLSAAGTLGKTVIYDGEDAYFQDSNIVWLDIDRTKIKNEYLYQCYQAIKWASPEGSTISRLYNGIIRNTKIPLPPTETEQHAIAEVLSDVDTLLATLDQMIVKKRDLKQAVMQQLLTGKTRLPGFCSEWQKKTLGELGATYGGITGKTKSDFGVGAAKYITFMNVMTNAVIDCTVFEQVNVSASETQNSVLRGDLLFNGSSETPEEVAFCSLMAEEVPDLYLNSFCFGFRLFDDQQVDGLFLTYYIRANPGREMMKSLAQGSTRYNLSKTALREASVLLPLKDEQVAIAEVLSGLDAELIALEARRDKSRNIKQAMMQQLLTGKTRLIAKEESHV